MVFFEDELLFVCTSEGTDLQVLGSGGMPCWTPDGESIVFSAYMGKDGADLFAVGRDGTNRRALTDDVGYDLWSEVSPNGKQVAYEKWVDDDFGPCSIWIVDLE